MNIISTILSETSKARSRKPINKEIFTHASAGMGKNEFLFILKPEVFAKTSESETSSILNLVLKNLEKYNLSIDSIRVLNASYLDKYSVIANHYGVINAAAKDFKAAITPEVQENFKTIYKQNISEVTILGALEISKTFPDISSKDLRVLWSSCEIKRLAGGIYCGKVNYNDQCLYLINGFHPPQLHHFTDDERVIITMNLSGDVDWDVARNKLIGNTYPEKAVSGSLRREAFDMHAKFGFDNVSYVINTVHLSAGPLEGLVELQRFNSEFHLKKKADISQFKFGVLLTNSFSAEQCKHILSNPFVKDGNKVISLFDLTEGMNSCDALEIIKSVIS